MTSTKTVAIIGAGPVGLAAAAHVLERRMIPIVLEAGPKPAHAVQQWRHVQLFSPWEYNIDRAAERLLAAGGWNSPDPQVYPTGGELIDSYLDPLATRTTLKEVIRTSSRVTAISRLGFDKAKTRGREEAPFEIRYQNGSRPAMMQADAVIDVSGTWSSPNPAGSNGLAALGEQEHADRIAYGMPDVLGSARARYAGKVVAVLGAGHSALGTLIDLAALKRERPDTSPIWLLRGTDPAKAFGGGTNDKLAARGELGSEFASLVRAGTIRVESGFAVTQLTSSQDKIRIATGAGCCARAVEANELVIATGFRPDLSFVSELRTRLDPALEAPIALAPLIDPNEHSCGTVRPHGARELEQEEPGFYIAGMKAYGRAPTFLMVTGYEQVRSIAAAIAGDREAAERVGLVLPETGVCTRLATERSVSNCCGGPAPTGEDACCMQDVAAKAAGQNGCGCS